MKNIIILYHANCPDGFGSAWAAWKKFGNKAEYIASSYGKDIPDGLMNKEIYLLDFSLPKDVLKKLIKNNKRVTGIDHHFSSEKETKSTHKYSFSLKNSGAVLSWKYFHPKKPVPQLLKYIEKIDLGKYSDMTAQSASVLLETIDFDFKAWNKLISLFEKSASAKKQISLGNIVLSYEKELIKTIASDAVLVSFSRKKVYALQIPKLPINFKSKIALYLINKQPPFAILWRKSRDSINVSLRSQKAFNILKIAQKYGGGGHKQSAGFSIPMKKTLPFKNVDSPSKMR